MNSVDRTDVAVYWSDTDYIEIPKIEQSWNGWWYRPLAARTEYEIKHGKAKSFGMGYKGQEEARRWLTNYVTREFAKRGDRLPVKIAPRPTIRDHNTYPYVPTIIIGYDHELWGQVVLGVSAPRKGDPKVFLTTSRIAFLYAHAGKLHGRYAPHEVVEMNDMAGQTKVTVSIPAYSGEELAERFLEGPTEVVFALTGIDRAIFDPPAITHVETPVAAGEFELGNGVTLRTMNGGHLLFPAARAATAAAGAKPLAEFVELLSRGTGTKVQIVKSYQNVVPVVTGLEISVKASGEMQHDHKIRIQPDGVTVECGYVKDEQRWIEYQRRHAADVLRELEGKPSGERETIEYDMKKEKA